MAFNMNDLRWWAGPNSWVGRQMGMDTEDAWNQAMQVGTPQHGKLRWTMGPNSIWGKKMGISPDMWDQYFAQFAPENMAHPLSKDTPKNFVPENVTEGYTGPAGSNQPEQEGGWPKLLRQVLEDIEGTGKSRRQEIETNYRNLGSATQQNLVNRGLLGSSLAPSAQMGIQKKKESSLTELEDALANLRASYRSSLGGQGLNAEERMGQWLSGLDAMTSMQNIAAQSDIVGNVINALINTSYPQLQALQGINLNYPESMAPWLQQLGAGMTSQNMLQDAQSQASNQAWILPTMLGSSLALPFLGAWLGPMLAGGTAAGTTTADLAWQQLLNYGMGGAASSDVNAKQDFEEVDVVDILERVKRLKVSTWAYKDEPGHPRHIGPMSQDFKEQLGFGDDDRYIGVIDAIGSLIASVQALAARLEKLEKAVVVSYTS